VLAPGDLVGRRAPEINDWAKAAIARLAGIMQSSSAAVAQFARMV